MPLLTPPVVSEGLPANSAYWHIMAAGADPAIIAAQLSEAQAISDQTAAYAAAAFALLSGKLFTSTAAGIAGVADTEPFLVQGGTGTKTFGQLYRRSGAAAIDQGLAVPSLAAVNAVLALLISSPGEGFALEGDDGQLLMEVTNSLINHPDMNATRANSLLGALASAIIKRGPGVVSIGMEGDNGDLFCEVTSDIINHPDTNAMRAAIEDLQAGGTGATLAAKPPRDPQWDDVQLLAAVIGAIVFGQSLSVGAHAGPPLTNSAVPHAKKFVGGVRPQDGGSDSSVTMATLADLVETSAGGNDETPVSGCIRMILQLLADEDGLTDPEQLFIGAAPGLGGQTVEQLSNPSVPFSRLADCYTYGQARAADLNKSFATFLAMVQGEENNHQGTSQATFTADTLTFRSQAEAAQAAAIGVNRRLPMITYQTATHLLYGVATPKIALAQLDMALTQVMIGMATPSYFLDFYTDHLHLANTGSIHLGAYLGWYAKRWLWDGYKPAPFVPVLQRSGSSILARFPVEAGKSLQLETWAGVDNYGAQLVDAGGTPIAITGVAQTGRASVEIRTATARSAGEKLRLGWVGDGYRGLTGFRDNSGDTLIFDPEGLALPLHRWAPICELTLT